jgi:hypothetical protein
VKSFMDAFEPMVESGMPYVITAVMLCQLIPELAEVDVRIGHAALRDMWIKISPWVQTGMRANAKVTVADLSGILLDAYFRHGGDWQRMQRGLIAACEIAHGIPQPAAATFADELLVKMRPMMDGLRVYAKENKT